MAETGSKKRKMGEGKRKADARKTKGWPLIKPKTNLQVTHLKDSHLFTVWIPVFPLIPIVPTLVFPIHGIKCN